MHAVILVKNHLVPAGQMLTLLMLAQTLAARKLNATYVRQVERPCLRHAEILKHLAHEGFDALNLVAAEVQYRQLKGEGQDNAAFHSVVASALDEVTRHWREAFRETCKAANLVEEACVRHVIFGAAYSATKSSARTNPAATSGFLRHTAQLVESTRKQCLEQLLSVLPGYQREGREQWIAPRKGFAPSMVGGRFNGWRTLVRNLSWGHTLDIVLQHELSTYLEGNDFLLVSPRLSSRVGVEEADGLVRRHFGELPLSYQAGGPAAEDRLPEGFVVSTRTDGRLCLKVTHVSALASILSRKSLKKTSAESRFIAQAGERAKALSADSVMTLTCSPATLISALEQGIKWKQDISAEESVLLEQMQTFVQDDRKREVLEKFQSTFSEEDRKLLRESLLS